MADNRLELVCRECGERFPFAKCMGADWYTSKVIGKFDDWLQEHSHGMEYQFDMEYEHPQKGS